MSFRDFLFPYDHKAGHNPALDGLRGWAVLLVLFGHAFNQGVAPMGAGSLLVRGKIGVYLFFIISAYLLDRQIIRVWREGRGNKAYWTYYASRRFLRIYPPFLLALLVFRVANSVGLPVVIHAPSEIFEHLFLMRGDHIFWSIPTEFVYYLLSPLLIAGFAYVLRWSPRGIFAAIVLLALGSLALDYAVELPRHNTLKYLSVFMFGLAVASVESLYPERFAGWTGHRAMPWLAVAAVVVLSVWSVQATGFTDRTVFLPVGALLSLTLLGAQGRHFFSQFLRFEPFRLIGAWSYSLYLFHIPVLMWVKTWQIGLWGQFLSFLVLSFFVGFLIHVTVERPFLKLGTRRR